MAASKAGPRPYNNAVAVTAITNSANGAALPSSGLNAQRNAVAIPVIKMALP